MVKSLLRAAVLAGVLMMVLGAVAVADDIWYPWWDRTPNVTYYWDSWTDLVGANGYAPDSQIGVGSATADVTVGDGGAGLFAIGDAVPGYGSKTDIWDMGPGGAMNLDVATNPSGMLVWVQVTYFQSMSVTPTVNVIGAQQIGLVRSAYEVRQVQQNLTLSDDVEPQQWVTYMSLWRLDPGAVFGGINIAADSNMGAVIDQVVVDTRVLPEPTAVVLALIGNCGLFALRRYRRK